MEGRGKPEGGTVRASDLDRARVAAELRVHCVEGRITVEELERRLELTMAAQTIRELGATVHDLPAVRVRDEQPQVRATVRVELPGSRPFTRRIVVPAPIKRVRTLALDTLAPGLNGFGYELEDQSPTDLRFARISRSGGLLTARAKMEWIVISFESDGQSTTTMIVHGRASRRVRKAFAQLSFTGRGRESQSSRGLIHRDHSARHR